MALAAARVAIERAGLHASRHRLLHRRDRDARLHLSGDGLHRRRKLGIAGTPAFDIEIACSGFIYGLTVASSLIQSGVYRRVLLVGAEELSPITNYADRGTAILFGDGAGAVVLEAPTNDSLLARRSRRRRLDPVALLRPGRRYRRAARPPTLSTRAQHDS